MELDLRRQGLALLLALLLGAGIGLAYDLLRPPRRRLGPLAGALLDLLFSAASGCAAFAYAMGVGDGRLGIWALGAALTGFLLYMHSLSAPLLRLFTKLLDILCAGAAAAKKTASRLLSSAKKALRPVRKWLSQARARLGRKKAPSPADGEEDKGCRRTSFFGSWSRR